MSPFDPARPRQLLPSILSKSLSGATGGGSGGGGGGGSGASGSGRSSTLPPIQRREKPARPRKSSITQNARKAQHEKKQHRSRGEHVRRMSYDGRKAMSAEPAGTGLPTVGNRWEDLIDAATSATEDVDGDRTPVSPSRTWDLSRCHLFFNSSLPFPNLYSCSSPFCSISFLILVQNVSLFPRSSLPQTSKPILNLMSFPIPYPLHSISYRSRPHGSLLDSFIHSPVQLSASPHPDTNHKPKINRSHPPLLNPIEPLCLHFQLASHHRIKPPRSRTP